MFNFGIISNINKATRGKQHYTTKIDFIHKLSFRYKNSKAAVQ